MEQDKLGKAIQALIIRLQNDPDFKQQLLKDLNDGKGEIKIKEGIELKVHDMTTFFKGMGEGKIENLIGGLDLMRPTPHCDPTTVFDPNPKCRGQKSILARIFARWR